MVTNVRITCVKPRERGDKILSRGDWLICLCLLFFTACKPMISNVDKAIDEQILHFGNGAEPQSLDPHLATGLPESHILQALLEGLVGVHPQTLAPVPGAAKSWDVSADLTEYTFHLQPNGRWSNGDLVRAQDFVYAWRRLLTPSVASEYSYQLHVLKNAEAFNKGDISDFSKVGVKALDDLTLQVTLRAPTPYFLSMLSHSSTFPVHQGTIETFGEMDDRGNLWTRAGNYVGNGPFVLTEWALNRIIRVEPNAHYWDAKTVKLNEIRFYPISNITTEERMFRSGTLHVTNELPKEKIAPYKTKQPDRLRIDPYLGTYFYRFNTNKKPLDDVRVRRALAMSIDRQQLVTAVLKGGQIPAYNYTPPNTLGYTPEAKLVFDIEKAKQLLTEAGYPNGEGLPPIEILYNTSESHRKVAVAIQQMWKINLGVDVAIFNQDWKSYLSTINNANYSIARAGWIGDYVDPNTFLNVFLTGGGNNRTGFANSEYDKFIQLASTATNQTERYAYFQQAEAILVDQVPIIPIYTYTRVFLKHPSVQGWYANVLDRHPYKHVYLATPATTPSEATHD